MTILDQEEEEEAAGGVLSSPVTVEVLKTEETLGEEVTKMMVAKDLGDQVVVDSGEVVTVTNRITRGGLEGQAEVVVSGEEMVTIQMAKRIMGEQVIAGVLETLPEEVTAMSLMAGGSLEEQVATEGKMKM